MGIGKTFYRQEGRPSCRPLVFKPTLAALQATDLQGTGDLCLDTCGVLMGLAEWIGWGVRRLPPTVVEPVLHHLGAVDQLWTEGDPNGWVAEAARRLTAFHEDLDLQLLSTFGREICGDFIRGE